MNPFESLILEYKDRGIVIDTNLLMLLLMGRFNSDLIEQYSRTEIFTKQDYHILERITSIFSKIITLPNVLTEASNLFKVTDRRMFGFHETFRKSILSFEEVYVESSLVSSESSFQTLGLADSAIMNISRENYLVITVDLPLYNFLLSNDIGVINFNHIRGEAWFSES